MRILLLLIASTQRACGTRDTKEIERKIAKIELRIEISDLLNDEIFDVERKFLTTL